MIFSYSFDNGIRSDQVPSKYLIYDPAELLLLSESMRFSLHLLLKLTWGKFFQFFKLPIEVGDVLKSTVIGNLYSLKVILQHFLNAIQKAVFDILVMFSISFMVISL
jgi:hypothetical protein